MRWIPLGGRSEVIRLPQIPLGVFLNNNGPMTQWMCLEELRMLALNDSTLLMEIFDLGQAAMSQGLIVHGLKTPLSIGMSLHSIDHG
jgi:hypothetical protein